MPLMLSVVLLKRVAPRPATLSLFLLYLQGRHKKTSLAHAAAKILAGKDDDMRNARHEVELSVPILKDAKELLSLLL